LWEIGDRGPWRAEHLSAIQIKYIVGEEEFNRCFKFSFVRNPWSLCISKYHFSLEENRPSPRKVLKRVFRGKGRPRRKFHEMSFEDWMAKHYAGFKNEGRDCNQLVKLTDLDGNVIVDVVGRLECMQEDFSAMCNRIGLPNLKVPHKNKTKHEHYSVYYDHETREMVADLYRRDIEYFGYAFESASVGVSAKDILAGEDRHV
jgi:chondroitin 4-sulfotransferase 11